MTQQLRGVSAAKTAVVIGAGFGGLAVALRLLARGYNVDLLEKHEDLGGEPEPSNWMATALMPGQPSLPRLFFLLNCSNVLVKF